MGKPNIKVYLSRRRLFLVTLLNFSDWICTMTILRNNGFFEVNPFMANLINNPLLCFFIKCVIPFALSLYIYLMLPCVEGKLLSVISWLTFGIAGFYLAINIVHIFNFIILFIVH